MANKKNVEANKKNTEIKNKKSNELEQKKPTKKKKLRLHSHLKVNIPLFQSLMMILPSLAKHASAQGADSSGDTVDQLPVNNMTEKDVTDDHGRTDSSAVTHQEAQKSDSDVNSTLSASHDPHGSSSNLVPSHHLSTLSHPQVHYIPSVSIPTISSGSNGQPTHSNAPTTPALPVTFIPEVIKGTYGELHVDANGQYTFVLNPKSPQYILLNQHQQGTDHFLLHLSNGSSVIVQVPVTGKQDTPSISGDLTGVVTEDHNIDSQGLLHANGKIDVVDPDQSESSVTPEVISGKYGSLTIDADGHWQYQVDNSLSNIQALTAATSLHESFTIHTKDGTPQAIDMTIGGNDDNAVITGVDAGTVTEDLTTQLQGQLSVTDSDLGEDHFQASQVTSNFGTLSINKDGAWTYDLDNNNPVVQGLGQGSTATDIVTVHSVDGTSHQVTITVKGTNDAAVIGGANSGAVTEESQLQTSGTLTVTDIDTGESHFSNTDVAGSLGTLHLTDSGAWTYDLDNTNPTLQALGKGSTATDMITVHSADGTPHQITVTVNGTNDKAVIGGTSSGAVTEESQLQTSGTLTITDVDTGEAHFSNTDIVGSFGTLHLKDNGAWTYDLDNTNPKVQELGQGATATDTITIHSADGTPHQVTITVNGTNDTATVSSATVAIDETDKAVTTSGTLTSTDVDNPDNAFTPDSISGTNGDLTIDANGHWTFTANSSFNQLNVGDKVEETFTVSSVDGTTSTVKVTINGTNDAPVINAQSHSVVEGGSLLNGQMVGHDIDTGATLTYSAPQVDGLVLNPDGSYSFDPSHASYLSLASGATKTLTIPVTLTDEHHASNTQNLSITITGANNSATISGVSTGDVDEGHGSYGDRSPDYAHPGMAKLGQDAITADGKLDIVDPDSGEAQFDPKGGAWNNSYHGQYGHLLLNSDGTWHYDVTVGGSDWVGNKKTTIGTTIDQLGEGQTLTDTITIQSKDGTTHDIVITIHGDNDRPYCSSEVQLNSGKEDTSQTLTTKELLSNTIDVDNNDAGILSIANLHSNHGSIRDNHDGTYTFTPAKDYNGQVHFTYDVKDAHGGVTHTGASTTLAAVDDKTIISGINHGVATEDVATLVYTNPHIMDAVDWQALQITDVDSPNTQVTVEFAGKQYTWNIGSDLDVTTPYGKFQFHTIASGSHKGEHSWSYIGDNYNVHVQELKHGESLTESIKLIATDGTEFPITVKVNGTEDGIIIDSKSELGHVVENAQTGASVSGNVIAHDVDLHDTVSWTQTPTAGLNGQYGTFHLSADGQWHYDVDQSKATKLGDGDEYWEHFTVEAVSTDGSHVSKSVSVVVHGNNDAPTVSGEVSLPSGKEDTSIHITQAELIANATDVDTNDRGWLHVENLTADHGSLVSNSDGSFTFNPDPNYNGQVHFTYDVTDRHGGIAHTGANTTLAAVNDASTLASASGSVTEDQLSSSSNVELSSGWQDIDVKDIDSVNDADVVTIEVNGIQHKVPADFAMTLSGHYGTFTTTHNSITGQDRWIYTVDNTRADIQGLSTGDSLQDTMVLITADGTRLPVTATIHGADDHVIIDTPDATQAPLGTVIEDTKLTTSGTLLAHDLDSKDSTSFTASNMVGKYGTLSVSSDGTWHYDLDPAKANVLSQGQRRADGFDITAISTDGSTTTKRVEVWVDGKDDAATIAGQDSGQVTEDTHLQTSGSLTVTDADTGEAHFSDADIKGTLGTLHLKDNGDWTYDLDNNNPTVQALGANKTAFDNITVHSADGTSHNIKITIHGTDDLAKVTITDIDVTETEAIESGYVSSGAKPITGVMQISDIDSSSSHFAFTMDHGTKGLGTLTVWEDGHYKFDLDSASQNNQNVKLVESLKAGEVLTDEFKVTTSDGQTKTIQLTIHGEDDQAVIVDAMPSSLPSTQNVTEDHTSTFAKGELYAGGRLNVIDADHGDAYLKADDVTTVHGGHFHILENGRWSYTIDNSLQAVQQLSAGESFVEQVVVTSKDGSGTHTLQVTVNGTNDQPILGVTQTTPTTGTLTETDADVNDTHTFSVVSSAGQFGSLSVDPTTGDYVYTPNTSITGMSYNSATNTYHGVDVFEVKVSDGQAEDSKFITFDASGHVTMSPTGGLVISTTVPQQPTVTATQPTLSSGTNVAPTNTVTLDLASTSDSGSSNTDNLTNDTTPTITGHTDIPFSKVTVYDGSTPVGHAVSDASGQYSVAVSSLSEGDHNLSAKALAPSSVVPATSSLLSVHIDTQVHVGIQTDPITADNVINAQESNSSIDITGSVSGDYNAGDIVTLDVNGTQHTGAVDAKGHYSIAVPGSELIADADQKIEASVAVTDTAGNSAHATADVTYQVDTQGSVPTITFENAGADNLYSKAEIARGQANTITATVTPPGDAKIGEHLVVNGQDHVLDAHTLQYGIQIEVHPGSNVQATMTDEHGNTAGSQGFAASAIPEPIIVRPPSGSHQVSGTLGVPPLLPSLTPVPTAQSGWRIHLPNGQYVTSHQGQYGTLTIDPQTGQLHYQEQAQVHTGPHGSTSGIGQHEDKFEVALQGTNQDEVVAHVNIQILSHGPGGSGKLTIGTEVVDMTITPVVHTSHPAPPPPTPVQHDEPDMTSQSDVMVTQSDDIYLDLTQQTHQEPDQKTSHHGAAAYLDALGIKPDATSTTVHDQPADMDIVLAQVDQQHTVDYDQAHLDMSDALEHHDTTNNHNQDDEHHHHNDVDGLPDIDPNN
ncbi:VCBS domain-containing protein [Vibrio europaeus]|uniref:VCBS domain-containing protein n=1 Tax=Vibrio europaeus TaxID=300876 RepID=UPI0023405D4A|nr:VCBS domain-containing protein [Vibrio europaeus]MDC5841135.1 VCBS domain-containing protein [Vibrio europaeus]